MKLDNYPQEECNMGNPERSNKALKRKKTTQKIIAITSVALLILLAAVLVVRKNVRAKYGNRGTTKVQTTQVTTGSIRTTVSGSGSLTSEDIEDVNFPTKITVDSILVKQGDDVEEGTPLAAVDTNSVLAAMSSVQEQLTTLDKQIVTASDEKVDSRLYAGVSGRLKALYASTGDDVAAVMYEHGALALVSLDEHMAVDLESDKYTVGETVSVVTSGGKYYDGTVDTVKDHIATVLITDNGPLNGDTVTVNDQDQGTLYIHSPLKVTGYAGTVSSCSVQENTQVFSTTCLFVLKDTDYTATYDQLLNERSKYEDLYQDLVQMYMDGAILSPISGTVETVIDLDDETLNLEAAAAAASLLDEMQLATIDPNKTMSATITVDESDILSLSVGQEAVITVESIGEETYPGEVTEIDTNAVSASGVTMYTAKITLDKAKYMLSGMTADVDVTIEGVENAMLVPYDAVRKTSASAYVYTSYDAETDTLGGMTEVTIGINNGKQMEIISGLNPGDTIYYTPKEQTFSFGNFIVTTGGSRTNSHTGSTGSSSRPSGMGGAPGGMGAMPPRG